MNIIVENQTLTWNGVSYPCAIGKNGLTHSKVEGDLKTPIGTYLLRELFYRADRVEKPSTSLPCREITPDMGWCDDPKSAQYNQLVDLPFAESHEKLYREEHVYDLIVPLGYNDNPATPGKGSAIFFHIARPDFSGTEGCVAVTQEALLDILKTVDSNTCLQIIG